MRIFRLHRRQRPAADFSGSLLFAGRWNPAGTPLLYASTALSLACLELLVHLTPDEIPVDYVYTSAEIGATIGVSPSIEFLREAGRINFTVGDLLRYSKALKVTLSELVK